MTESSTIWIQSVTKSRCPITLTGDGLATLMTKEPFNTFLTISVKAIAKQIKTDAESGLFLSGMTIDHGACSVKIGVSKTFPRYLLTPLEVLNTILGKPSQIGLVPLDQVDESHRITVQIDEKGVPALICGVRCIEGADYIDLMQRKA